MSSTTEEKSTASTDAQLQSQLEEVKPTAESQSKEQSLKPWLAVAGAFLVQFCTFGYVNAFGVFQAYYTFDQLRGYSSSDISWIGSVQLFLLWVLAVVSGKLFDKGYFTWLLLVGSILHVLFILVLSVCDTYAEIFVVQALGQGLSNGLLYLTSLACVSRYFAQHRAFALGVAVTGSGLGGVCFPILLNNLIKEHGFAEGVRASGYLVLPCLVLANILMRNPVEGHAGSQIPEGTFKSVVSDKAALLSAGGCFFVSLGYFIPFFYLQVFFRLHGISEHLTFYSLAILNGVSVIGRLVPNLLADKLGVINLIIPIDIATAAITYAWVACTKTGSAITFCVLFGFFSGAINSLLAPLAVSFARAPHEIGLRMGIASLIGNPIAGRILSSANNDYWSLAVWSGTTLLFSNVLFFWARQLEVGRKGTQRV
ncbi:MFS general substrate transporter [Atractiella rhizophila]|nr:MFS general substrate transporter [Atractiella rhizophila]